MKRTILAATLFAAATAVAGAQVKTLPGEMKTETATVEAIDHGRREVTLKEANGLYSTVMVPADNKKFDTIKVGDKVTARYYDNVVIRVKHPGEKSVDSDTAAVTGVERKAGRHCGHPAHHYGNHHGDRHEDPVDHVHRPE